MPRQMTGTHWSFSASSTLHADLKWPLTRHRLKIECERAPRGSGKEYINDEVKSGELVWIPQGEQENVFAEKPPAPTNTVSTFLKQN